MKKSNISTIIDYGRSEFRLGVFGENFLKLNFLSKDIDEKNNYDEQSSTINFLIKEAEKKISSHIENVILLYDSPDFYSIDISLRKDFDQKVLVNDIYNSIILEANQLIKNNYLNNKIIHVITTKKIVDGKEINVIPNKELNARSIILEIKFISLPKESYNNILKILKKNNLQILNFFCSSYVKSYHYIESFNKYKLVNFIDIGHERSTLISYDNKKLVNIKSIPIGGNHITKDISKVLNLNLVDSESIKKSFNKSENEFSYDKNINEGNYIVKEILDKSISIDLLKKVVLSRIEEIFDLLFKDLDNDFLNNCKNSALILTGNGSKLFNKNSFHLNEKYTFEEINFYEEEIQEICESGLNFEISSNLNDIKIVTKNQKRAGFFEKFFNFFSR